MSGHATVEMPEECSSRSDSSGSHVLFTYLKPTQKKSQKMGKWTIIFIEVVVFVLFLGGLIANLTDHLVKKNHVIWVYPPWKWCVLVLVIVSSRRIMGWMMDGVVFLIKKFLFSLLENIFLSMKHNVYYTYHIYSLRKSIRAVLWFGSVLLTWFLLFKNGGVKESKRDSQVLKYVKRTIATSVIGGFLWVLKTLLVNALSSPIQATRLFDRFRESLIDQYILYVFSAEASTDKEFVEWINRNHLPPYDCIPEGKPVKVINWLKKIQPNKLSAWTMKELIKVIRTTQLSSLITDGGVKVINCVEKLEPKKLSALTMKELIKVIRDFQLSSIREELDNPAKMEEEVEKTQNIANKILERMNSYGEIQQYTLERLFDDEASDVVQHINGGEEVAGNEVLTLGRQALRKWLVDALHERRSLAESLENTERTIKHLNKLISWTALIAIFFLWLIMLRILTTEMVVAILTQFVALAFIFGDTGKSVFQGIVFVFVMHPFDIGDCCLIHGEEMVVEKIYLLSSVFRKNGKDTMIFPNSYLITSPINKIKRAKSQVESQVESQVIDDSVEISISSSTSTEQLAYLRQQIQRFLEDDEDRWFLLKHNFRLKEIEDQKLKIVLGVSYREKEPISEEEIVMCRRDLLVSKLKRILEEGGITYHRILFKAIDAE